MLGLGAIAVLGPATAAQKVPWRSFLWHQGEDHGKEFFVQRLCEADRNWAAAFVSAASEANLGEGSAIMAGVVRRVAIHHQLPCPVGATFLRSWTSGVPEMSWNYDRDWKPDPIGWLTTDPLMPDIFYGFLEVGDLGHAAWLPACLPELVARGTIDRDRVIAQVLVNLTTSQRPASQKVLVEMLRELEMRIDEVSGGIAYLLGVIATSKLVVGKYLLPMALASLEAPEDLAELTATIAGRSEKMQKVSLLAALKGDDLRTRFGLDTVRASLETLAIGNDAAFTNKARAALEALPGADAFLATAVEPEPTGLWDLDPTPTENGRPHCGHPDHRRAGWNAISVGWPPWPGGPADLADELLTEMRAGTFEAAVELDRVRAYLAGTVLSLPPTVTVLRELFVSGGLRKGYPFGMALAELASSLAVRPAGLADLFRCLAEFAHEVPKDERPVLPHAVAVIAAGRGKSKAEVEARVLGARLAGLDPADYRAAANGRQARGIWRTLPSSVLADAVIGPIDATTLGSLLAWDVPRCAFNQLTGRVESRSQGEEFNDGIAFCAPDLVLDAVVRSVIPVGLDRVQEPFRKLPPSRSGDGHQPYMLALNLWVEGDIDARRFWLLAREARTTGQVRAAVIARERATGRRDLYRDDPVFKGLWGNSGTAVPDNLVEPDHGEHGLVLAGSLEDAGARLEFLRHLESLILSTDNSVVLSTPVRGDATLDLETLLGRLRQSRDKPIGPLDLVQALHRLQPCDPARVADIKQLAAEGGTWRTSAALTTPEGDASWPVLDLVAEWVAAGGLPDLDASLCEHGTWSTNTIAPVPWTRCVGLPAELRTATWSFAGTNPVVVARTLPWWPDQVLRPDSAQHEPVYVGIPVRMSGRFGRPLHDDMFRSLLYGITKRQMDPIACVRAVARRGRLEPDLWAEVVLRRFDQGRLDLKRLVQATQVLYEDSLPTTWECGLAVAEELCGREVVSDEWAGYLSLLAAYAIEVPNPKAPAALRAFGMGEGNGKSRRAVRGLLAAIGNGSRP